jgi:FAD/FMN-containing dehydrogenase
MTSVDANTARDALPSNAIEELVGAVRGPILRAGDDGYDEARAVWNAAIDRRPALIVRCTGPADVMAAVRFAGARGLPVAVRGGGHNVSGSGVCEGGVLIDASSMKGIHVDPARRLARAEAGVTWGELDHETQAVGLATTGGFCSETGIAGVTLGAGFGWLMRKYGTSLDNLVSFDIVTPDGQLRTVSENENPDLFFAVRGSHSNFGVVTSFEYRLHEVGPTVLAGMLVHPLQAGKEALRFYQKFALEAPEELGSAFVSLTAPDGNAIVAVLICYHGDLNMGEEVIRPLRQFGPPVADMVQPMPYAAMQSMFDQSFPPGRYSYWKSSFLNRLDNRVIDALVDGFADAGSPYSSILIEHLGGAVTRVGKDASAFSHRDAPFNCVIMPMWTEATETEKHVRWADSVWQGIQHASTGGVYVNYLGNEPDDRVRAAYGQSYPRLAELKRQYDPGNLFRFNQNIV